MRGRTIYTVVAKSSICNGSVLKLQCGSSEIARTLVQSGTMKVTVRSGAVRTAVWSSAVRVTDKQEKRLVGGSRDNGHLVEDLESLGVRRTIGR